MKKRLFLLVPILLFASGMASAQPGADPSRFNPRDKCLYSSLERSVVFVGHVLSVEEIQSESGQHARKLVARAETVLKGEVNQEQELYMPGDYYYPESSIPGHTFVFMANEVTNEWFTGLYADKWSYQVDGIDKEEWARDLSEIRAIFRGVAQPRIVGVVTEWPWNARFGLPGGKSDHPLVGITVVAEDKDRNRFTTETDEAGGFQFDKLPLPRKRPATHNYLIPSPGDQLPAGTYTVSLVLPKKMDVYVYYGVLLDDGKQAAVQIGTALCSATLQFGVQESGSVNGQLERETGIAQTTQPQLLLHRIEPETKRIFSMHNYFAATRVWFSGTGTGRVVNFSFQHIPVGPYILEMANTNPDGTVEGLYYPNTKLPEEAAIINVTANKPTKLEIRFPW